MALDVDQGLSYEVPLSLKKLVSLLSKLVDSLVSGLIMSAAISVDASVTGTYSCPWIS